MTAKTYESGEPCKRGHLGPRYRSSRNCVACVAERLAANPARRRAVANGYYHRHRERIAADRKSVYEPKARRPVLGRDPVKTRIRSKRYDDAHREEKRKRGRAYTRANPDKMNAWTHARRVRLAGCEGRYTPEDVAAIRLAQGDRCIYCEMQLNGRGTVDHIVPVTRGGSNWPSNIQLTCKPCNSAKGNKLPQDFASSHYAKKAAFALTEAR